jgi:hypothetical protein
MLLVYIGYAPLVFLNEIIKSLLLEKKKKTGDKGEPVIEKIMTLLLSRTINHVKDRSIEKMSA